MQEDYLEQVGVCIFSTVDPSELKDVELLLQALNVPYAVVDTGIDLEIHVSGDLVDFCTSQIKLYTEENKTWPPAVLEPVGIRQFILSTPGALITAFILSAMYNVSVYEVGSIDWKELGLANNQLIKGGEWWRCVTALTLHSGVGHLLGNIIFGTFFAAYLCQCIGNSSTWFFTLICGAVGNLLTAWIYADLHRSVGASTAIFALVGILVSINWRFRHFLKMKQLIRALIPLIVGVSLLGMLGTSGVRTDVVAHCSGFACGVVAGVLLNVTRYSHDHNRRFKWYLNTLTAVLLIGSWILGIRPLS